MVRSLKHPSPFHPLPREFIAFTYIACRAGQHKIVNTICGDGTSYYTTQRISMFDMEDILTFDFLEFSVSTCRVIATSFLALELLLNLLRGMGASNPPFTGSIGADSCMVACLICLIVTLASFRDGLFVFLAIALVLPRNGFFIDLIINLIVFLVLFFMCIIPDFLLNNALFSFLWLPASLPFSFVFAFLALIIEPKDLRFIAGKKLFSQRINIFAFWTSFISFRRIIWLNTKVFAPSTSFTDREKTIFIRSIPMKIGGCCWETIDALFALFLRDCLTDGSRNVFNGLVAECVKIECALSQVLRYTGIHGRNLQLSFIAAPVIAVTRGQNHIQLPQHYIINPLQKQCEVAL